MSGMKKICQDKCISVEGFLCALCISFLGVYGWGFHLGHKSPLTEPRLFFGCLLMTIILTVVFSFMMKFQVLRAQSKANASSVVEKHRLRHARLFRNVIAFGIMIIGWIPYWLAAYPGFFTYDATNVFIQHFYGQYYSTHHPLIHSILIGDVVKLVVKFSPDNYNLGISALSWLEMLMGAATFTYMLDFTYEISNGLVWGIGVFYLAFFPTIGMFASCSTKDTFSAFWMIICIVSMIKLCKWEESIGKKMKIFPYALLVIAIVLMLLYRKNILIAYLIFVPIFLWIHKKNLGKWGIVLLLGLIGYFVCNTCLEMRFQPEKGGLCEALCVPLQQLGKTYETEGDEMFTDEERELFYRIHPDSLSGYHDLNADFIKGNMNEEELRGHLGEFLIMWLRIGVHHPVKYVEAFLKNTYQAWYPFCNITGYMERADTTYTYFKCDVESPGELDSKLPQFYDFLWQLSRETSLYEIPVVGIFFTIALYFLLLIYVFFWGLYIRSKDILSFAIFMLAMTFTAMCGPLVLPRYYIYLFYTFPLMLGYILGVARKV
ncbi:MAG: hypothetical protein IJ794_09205 [Lachnospiraceae bacterium]|nr:hypothetical protein [Lachnospiraceae bacterium]